MTRFKILAPLALLVGGTGIGGCHRGISADEARRTAVITVAGASLPGATFERWLLALPSRPQRASAALLSAWIDEALLASAKAAGTALDDSVTVDDVIYPEAARAVGSRFVIERAGKMPVTTDHDVDSLLKLDQVRVFQQIGLMVPKGTDSATAAATVARAKALRSRAVKDTNGFTALVREASEDTTTKRTDGYLPAVTAQDLLQPVQRPLWMLRPGEISRPLVTPNGLYIVRRATAGESREAVRNWMHDHLARNDNGHYLDSLLNERQLHVAPDAPSRIRTSLREPLPVPEGSSVAWWNGGTLSPAKMQLWIASLSAANRLVLATSADTALDVYVSGIAKQEIFLAAIAPHGPITPELRKSLGGQYRAALDTVWTQLQRVGGTGTIEARANAMVDALVGGTVRVQKLPPGLGGVLRRKFPVKVNSEAIDVLIQGAAYAWRSPAARDSLAAAAAKGRGTK